jgi:AraC-like DNA-binding protein
MSAQGRLVRHDWAVLDPKLRALVAQGLHRAALARALGVHDGTLDRRMQKLGLAYPARRWSPVDWDALAPRVRALLAEGLLITEIAARLGMHESTVRGGINRLGLRPAAALAPGALTPGELRALCARAFEISEAKLIGRGRLHPVVVARHAAFWVMRARFPAMSYPMIARLFAGRDHSTIIHGCRQTEARMARDPALRAKCEALVAGRCWEPQDAHVRQWQALRVARVLAFVPVKPELEPARASEPDGDEGLPKRFWCDQCQSLKTEAAAQRCAARWCSLAPAFRQGVAA